MFDMMMLLPQLLAILPPTGVECVQDLHLAPENETP